MKLIRANPNPHLIGLALIPSVLLAFTNGWYGPYLNGKSPGLFWAADAIQFLVVPVATMAFLTRYARVRPRDYGFRPPEKHESFFEFVGITLFVTAIYWLLDGPCEKLILAVFGRTEAGALFVVAVPQTQPWHFLFVLYASVTAGLLEEPIYRSLPWLYLSRIGRAPVTIYCIGTSLMFGLVHWEQGLGPAIAAGVVGLGAAALYPKIGNIWPFVIAHIASGFWNYQWL